MLAGTELLLECSQVGGGGGGGIKAADGIGAAAATVEIGPGLMTLLSELGELQSLEEAD